MAGEQFVIITGLSGAGKTEAIRAFEDLGFFCVDNLPATLIPKFAELCAQSGGRINRIALVVDIRSGEFFDSLQNALSSLEEMGITYEVLFLEASLETLVRRFKETRRPHPLASSGGLIGGIEAERKRLEEFRRRATRVIDTSNLTPKKLREKIADYFGQGSMAARMAIAVVSFGFKYGLPIDADLVFDVRFLPNPHYVESLRDLTGLDGPVKDYVLNSPLTRRFIQKLFDMLDFLLPNFIREGKTQLVIGVGCTGGKHRSVAISEELGGFLGRKGYRVVVDHRDMERKD